MVRMLLLYTIGIVSLRKVSGRVYTARIRIPPANYGSRSGNRYIRKAPNIRAVYNV